jgi:multimeric flavodoxin WrbA
MNILAIGGSMREDSNTNKLVKIIAKATGAEYELIDLTQLTIKPCTGCMECMMNEGQCPIDDDMQEVYDKLMTTDALIVGSPTYYLDVSAAVKALIDRSMALNYRGIGPMANEDMPWLGQHPLSGKLGVCLVTVAGAGHERALESLRIWMADCHCLELVAQLAEPVGMGDVDEMPEVIQRAVDAGKKLGEMLRNKK